MKLDTVIHNVPLALTMDEGEGVLGERRDVAVAVGEGVVQWVGPTSQAPSAPERVDGAGCVLLPGLVDAHTHAVWAGSRAAEFERRLDGVPYAEILEAGGGILSTVRWTREAGYDELVRLASLRLAAGKRSGITTREVKSGYGLSVGAEKMLLQAAAEAGRRAGVRVSPTFLGAHTVPAEWRHDRVSYVQQVIYEQLPTCAPLAEAIDAYVDRGAFTVDEARRILGAGKAAGLEVAIHAEQVSHTGAAVLAGELGARSAEHLERIDAAGIQALADANVSAVLLPGAQLYLRDPSPPVDALREAGVRLVVATDLNPGTSPVNSLWTAATLACTQMRVSVAEALLGMTRHAADTLKRPQLGRIRVGCPADLVLARPPAGEPVQAASLIQHLGGPEIVRVFSAA